MVKTDNHNPRLEPDPKWLPLADAIFFYTYTNELASGESYFSLDYTWANAPAAIELDPASRAFKLSFNDGRVIQLLPWELLKSENLPANGLVAAFAAKAVWTTWQLMLERFASAVSDGRFRLFARHVDFRAPFGAVPRDHWRLYRVTDWSTGAAIAPDGQQICNIHCQPLVKPHSGRKPIYDQDQVDGEVRRLFRKYGPPGSGKEPRWQTRADVQERIAQFLLDTTGQDPAKSTLQILVKKALETVKAETT